MFLSWRDLLLAATSGLASGLLLIPVLLNVGVAVPRSILVLIPILVGAGGAAVGIWVLAQLSRFLPILFQFGKFLVVGVLNTLLDFGTLNLLSYLAGIYSGIPVAFFKAAAFSVAVTNSYFWNKNWTFGKTSNQQPATSNQREFLQFLLVSVVGLGIATGTVYILTTFVTPPGVPSPAVWENIANAIAVPLSLIWNFLGYKFLVFRR